MGLLVVSSCGPCLWGYVGRGCAAECREPLGFTFGFANFADLFFGCQIAQACPIATKKEPSSYGVLDLSKNAIKIAKKTKHNFSGGRTKARKIPFYF